MTPSCSCACCSIRRDDDVVRVAALPWSRDADSRSSLWASRDDDVHYGAGPRLPGGKAPHDRAGVPSLVRRRVTVPS